MAQSAIRHGKRIVAAEPLVGRYAVGESVLLNIAQVAAAGRQFNECSALEIGCASWVALRGLIELGIDYFGIDIRESNIEKSIEYFGQSLPDNVRYEVRAGQDVDPERDGTFDIVFVIGLIYHLDIRDTYRILDSARRMRRGGLVVDAPVWPSERTKVDYYQVNGNIYSGCTLYELKDLSKQEMETLDHASYGEQNYPSFHFDHRCMRRFLHNLGLAAVMEYEYDHNAQDFWGRPHEIMFNVMDWPILFCPGGHNDDERPQMGLFSEIPENGPNRSIAPEDLVFVLDRLLAHFHELSAKQQIAPLDVDRVAEMLPVRLLPHMLLAMIEADLPFELLIHSVRRYLIAPVRHGSPHDRAHALVTLLTMAKRYGARQPVWMGDLVRGFFEVFFYAYRGDRGRAEPLSQLMQAWSIEPTPPILALLARSTMAWSKGLWQVGADAIIRQVIDELPLEAASNRTEYRDRIDYY